MLVVAKDLALLEQAIHQRGLAVVNVRDDRDVANIAANPRGRLCFSYIHRLHGEARCPLLDPGHSQSTVWRRSNSHHMCGHTRSDCTICCAVAAWRRPDAHCRGRASYATVCGHKVPGMSWSPHRIPRLCRARRPSRCSSHARKDGTSRMDNAHATSRRRVLIVDDDPDLIDLLTDGLQLIGGYEVVVAPDGANGLETFIQTRPDSVVLDMRMPGLT